MGGVVDVAKSILIAEATHKRCFLCGNYGGLERHHVFGGSNRKLSEEYGLTVYLCHWCHNEPPIGVHHNKNNRLYLQRTVQRQAMKHYGWTEDQFRAIFGKSYL